MIESVSGLCVTMLNQLDGDSQKYAGTVQLNGTPKWHEIFNTVIGNSRGESNRYQNNHADHELVQYLDINKRYAIKRFYTHCQILAMRSDTPSPPPLDRFPCLRRQSTVDMHVVAI